MRTMLRNQTPFWYQVYEGEKAIVVNGLNTGRSKPSYSKAVECRGVISVATGWAEEQVFGNLEEYDRVITLSDHSVPITETSRIYLTAPSVDGEGNVTSRPDYIVKRVADSLNFRFIAIGKVAANASTD